MLKICGLLFHQSDKSFRNHLEERGFSLLSTVVASGIMAILALGLATLITNSSIGLRMIEIRSEGYNQMYVARVALSDELTCTLNFAGKQASSTVDGLYHLSAGVLNTEVSIFPTKAANQRVYPKTFRIDANSATVNALSLQIDFFTQGEKQGPILTLPFQVELEAGKIKRCTFSPNGFLSKDNLATRGGRACDNNPAMPKSIVEARKSALKQVCSQLSYPTPVSRFRMPISKVFSTWSGGCFPPKGPGVTLVGSGQNSWFYASTPLCGVQMADPSIEMGALFTDLASPGDCEKLPVVPEGTTLPGPGSSINVTCAGGEILRSPSAESDNVGSGHGGGAAD